MRTYEEYQQVKTLVDQGLNQCQVARATGIPRGTLRGWLKRGFCPQTGISKTRAMPDASTYLNQSEDRRKAYSFILGEYLGDGCIRTMPRGVYRLDIYNDRKYEGLNQLIETRMKSILPDNKVTRLPHGSNCWDIAVYSKNLPVLFPQIGKGKKHLRKIELTPWQLEIVDAYPHEFIKGLLYSDGSIYQHSHDNGKYVYLCYHFINKSRDIVDYYTRSLKQVGITKKPRWDAKRGIWVVVLYWREDCDVLSTFVSRKHDIVP